MLDIMSEEYETMIKEMREGKEVVETPWGRAKIYEQGRYTITSKKEGFNRNFVHILIWEEFYRKKRPDGYVIHHKDGNQKNNAIQNLQCCKHSKHVTFHNKGSKRSEETKQKMSEAKKNKYLKENHPRWKNYRRIVKSGFIDNKQRYSIIYENKTIKTSVYIHKLYKWFGKNYPNEYLYLEVN